ncbi:MAG: aminodeoxychorismate lyase [Candidatus Omnitrophota bacterium]
MQKVFLNGEFLPVKDANVSLLDRGFLYGDGVFETMRGYNGRVFMLDAHVDRLFGALDILKIKTSFGKKDVAQAVTKTVSVNRLKSAYVKVIVTRGAGPMGMGIAHSGKPTCACLATPLGTIKADTYKKGVSLGLSSARRNEKSFIAGIKSLNYLDNILAKEEARGTEYFDMVMLNSRGLVTETTSANIFMVKNGKVVTPPVSAGILPGVTRQAVIGIISANAGNTVIEKDISPDMLYASDEIFVTNSVLEIVPVVKLDRKMIGNGRPGPFSRTALAIYRKMAQSGREV